MRIFPLSHPRDAEPDSSDSSSGPWNNNYKQRQELKPLHCTTYSRQEEIIIIKSDAKWRDISGDEMRYGKEVQAFW